MLDQCPQALGGDDELAAITAAWELALRRSGTAGGPEFRRLQERRGAKPRPAAWFVGFVEGKCGVRVPRGWSLSLPTAPPGAFVESDWLPPMAEKACHNVEVRPVAAGGNELCWDGKSIRMEFDETVESRVMVWVSESRGLVFFATSGLGGDPHRVGCIDREKGLERWSVRLPVRADPHTQTGLVAHPRWFVRRGDDVLVFGTSPQRSMFIQSLDLATGAVRWSFQPE
jgi:outer membrane protein assembly factor BamB